MSKRKRPTDLEALAGDSRGDRELTDRRVEYIARRMAEGSWSPGASEVEAAKAWGLSPKGVRNLAGQAGRALRLAHGEDLDEIRGRLLASVEAIRKAAMGRERSYLRKDGSVVATAEPDLGTALRAVELAAKMTGALVDRSEVTQRTAESEMTEDELIAYAAAELHRNGVRIDTSGMKPDVRKRTDELIAADAREGVH